jgi:RNA polymerase sigma-70 factor (ECF subfamily)
MAARGDDRALLGSIARGEKRAFEELYLRHSTRVHRLLERMMGNRAMAEEVLNEVFLAVWQGAGRYEGRSEPLTWLLSIAHNKALSAMRGKRGATALLDDAVQIADDADTPDVIVQKENKGEIMRHCIDALSLDHRTILDLVYYQERSISEAAEILDIPEGTVKTRVFHARKKLSELLSARGIDRGWP